VSDCKSELSKPVGHQTLCLQALSTAGMVNLLFEGAKAFQQQLDEREALDNFMATCDGSRDKFWVRMHKVSLICPLLFLSCSRLWELVTVGQICACCAIKSKRISMLLTSCL